MAKIKYSWTRIDREGKPLWTLTPSAIEPPFEFNNQQKEAIDKAVAWYHGFQNYEHRKQVFFLAGYAGTGKTSVAKTIADLCAPAYRVVFVAPTGKAASRLRQKGCRGAKTLHQVIYNVRGEDEDGDPIFIGKGALDEGPTLIVCDEASMLGEWDNKQLMSHGICVLALGDTGQVPPVKQAAVYVKGREDVLLTEIERQNANSNIVRASMFVRQGKRIPYREYDDFRVRNYVSDADLIEHAGEFAQILCSRNDTRHAYNKRIRALLGFTGELPNIGEKIVCTFNQHKADLMNGEQGIVLRYGEMPLAEYEDNEEPTMLVYIKSLTTGKEMSAKFNPASFDKNEAVRLVAQKSVGGFDYGNVLTIHKSQGSEWQHILVIEEQLRSNYAELMYTAYTRAIDRCTVYRPS